MGDVLANDGAGRKNFGDEFDLQKLIEDMTLLLVHLTSWKAGDPASDSPQSWKGYDYDALDALAEKGYIAGSKRSNSVYLTEEGVKQARRLEEAFLESAVMTYRRTDADARIKARSEVEFFCEICQSNVAAPTNYEPFEQYRQGKISLDKIIELVRRYHSRHWHSDADKIYRSRFAYNVQNGTEFMEAANEAKDFAQKMVPGESRPSAVENKPT